MGRIETAIMKDWEFTLLEPQDQNFAPIQLPHDWAIYAPINTNMKQGAAQGFRDRWGIGWYKKKLVIPAVTEGHVYQLQFDGVYENSTVWVNGVEVGGHKYGYSRFTLDITSVIHEGENLILVKVVPGGPLVFRRGHLPDGEAVGTAPQPSEAGRDSGEIHGTGQQCCRFDCHRHFFPGEGCHFGWGCTVDR